MYENGGYFAHYGMFYSDTGNLSGNGRQWAKWANRHEKSPISGLYVSGLVLVVNPHIFKYIVG